MEVTEPIESINRQLIDHYGIDSDNGLPMYRIVWSPDEYEKRLSKFTREGLELIQPEVMLLPKYDQRDLDWRERYILEQQVLVPDVNSAELAGVVKSYEPIWVFRDRFGNYLPPTLWACKFNIDMLLAVKGKKHFAPYKDETPEAKMERIKQLENELFGDESSLMGGTMMGNTVGYTGPSKIQGDN